MTRWAKANALGERAKGKGKETRLLPPAQPAALYPLPFPLFPFTRFEVVMEAEQRFHPEEIEPRGTVCVECAALVVAPAEAVLDRVGGALCRPCAAEFYTPCAACGGLVPRDEALADPRGACVLLCVECFGVTSDESGEPPLEDEEVASLVERFVALHAEKRRVDERLEELKEQLKRAARSRPRLAGAVVLRAGEAGVRCSYTLKTTWDAEKLSAAEELLGGERFGALFERKTTYTPVRAAVEEFLAGADESQAAAREAVRAAARQTETETLNILARRKKPSS